LERWDQDSGLKKWSSCLRRALGPLGFYDLPFFQDLKGCDGRPLRFEELRKISWGRRNWQVNNFINVPPSGENFSGLRKDDSGKAFQMVSLES
jgi:hypothetical protein